MDDQSKPRYTKQLLKRMNTVTQLSPCILAYSAVLGMAGEEIGVFAKDMVALRQAWWKLAGDIPLNESRVQRVAIFSQQHLTELSAGGSKGG